MENLSKFSIDGASLEESKDLLLLVYVFPKYLNYCAILRPRD